MNALWKYAEVTIIAVLFAAIGVQWAVNHLDLTTPLGATAAICAGALGGFWLFLVGLFIQLYSRGHFK